MFEIDEYLGKIKENLPHGESELMHRPALEYLLSSMKEYIDSNVRIITEKEYSNQANNENYGTPDFSVIKDSLTLGLVENKRVGLISEGYKLFMENKKNKAQIEKYFNISNNIILTDYLNFYLLTKEEEKIKVEKSVTLCSKNDLKSKKKPKIDSKDTKNLKELFALFFTKTPESINDAKAFAKALALPASSLKDELLVLGQRDESGTIVNEYINNLYENFKKGIYEDLSFEDFADNFSQTLIYALLLGKIEKDRKGLSEDIDTTNITKFIPNCFAIINAIANELKKLERFSNLKWLIEHIIRVINHIDSATLILELNKYSKFSQENNIEDKDRVNINPFIYFYEYFIEAYNPRLRKERGVYYTPDSIVNFIINSIDSILRKHFRYEAGLSEAKKNNDITLLDFATGTGSFLLQAFYKAMQDTNIKFAKYEMDNLIRNFNGFEIMIAPYVIAHLNLALSLRDSFEYELKSDERFNVFLTNTLEDKPAIQSLFIEFQKEAESAHAIKNSKILIITGNPPYRGASSNQSSFKKEVHVAYKEPMESPGSTTVLIRHGQLYREKNPKMLLDDYVKFIRFAERKIESQEAGIFAFISNNGFLDNPTFRGMRYHLMQTFDRLYILDLHGNTRKKETTPEGGKDDNVFDIMQGVSINIFVKSPRHSMDSSRHCEGVKRPKQSSKSVDCHDLQSKSRNDTESKEPHCQIYHYDLYGKRKDKYNFLYDNSLDSIPWNRLNPKPPFFLFIPQNESLREEYDKGISVKDMFRISGVGICSKRDNIVFHNSKDSLKKLLEDFITKPKEELYRIYDIGEDSRDWKLDSAIEAIKENKDNLDNFIMKCHYRPFDYRYTYYINKSRAFMAYPVYDVFEHFLQDSKNKALLVSRQASAIGEKNFDATFISDKMVDINLYRRGGEQVMPLYLQNTESTQKNLKKNAKNTQENGLFSDEDLANDIFQGKERIENFTPEFRAFVDSKYTWNLKDIKANPQLFLDSNTLTPEAILGYIYAVLFHKDYREKYLDFLKIDFPKIPFVESKEKFIALSKLGLELMSVHLMADNERERERDEGA